MDDIIKDKKKRGRLILSRNSGQSIIIKTDTGELISVTIMELKPYNKSCQARILINAPLSFHIDREEIFLNKVSSGFIEL